MTDLREAAQMALDALIDAADSQSWEMQQNIEQHGEWYRRSVYLKQATAKSQEAIEALRAALAQPPCATGAQCVGGKCERCAVQEREWVGLTDEERKEIIRQQKDFWGPVGWELECAKAIEAKLREKNFDRPS